MQRFFLLIIVALFCGFSVSAFAATDASTNLIANGDFEKSKSPDAGPDGWPKASENISYPVEENNHFVRMKVTEPGKMVMLYRLITITPDDKALQLSFRVRHEGIEVGKSPWFDGRIMMNFKDADKKTVKPSPSAPYFRGTKKEWKTVTVKFAVPEGAKTLEFMPALFNAAAGTLDLDDFTLVRIAASEVPPPPKSTASPVVPAPAAEKLPPKLHVQGAELLTPDGKAVWLQGVAIPSLEWNPQGENIVKSINISIEQWHSNVIRLPVSDEFWFGKSGYQTDGGAGYRQIVDSAVNTAAAHGAYLVLDLHRYKAPTQAHAIFWKSAASHYANHPAVLFGLFNEPHGITWDVWRNGGLVPQDAKPKAGVAVENNEVHPTFQSIGIQALISAIRETGAKNIVVAGGLDWAYDLSGIVNGYALEDPMGDGIMYDTHIYNWKRDWAGKVVPLIGKYPILLGECGADANPMSFIPASAQETPETWVPDMLGFIQKNKLNWTAWSFHPHATPRVILDWDYTPTPFWGKPAKDALAGQQFTLQKMR